MDTANDGSLLVEIEPFDSSQSSQRSSILFSNAKKSDDRIVFLSIFNDERIESTISILPVRDSRGPFVIGDGLQ